MEAPTLKHSRSLKLRRSLSRLSLRHEKTAPVEHPPLPPIPPIDTYSTSDSQSLFERPAYLQPLTTRAASSAGTPKRTSFAYPKSMPTSPTRPVSRSVDILAARQSFHQSRQSYSSSYDHPMPPLPKSVDIVTASQAAHSSPRPVSRRTDSMTTQSRAAAVRLANDEEDRRIAISQSVSVRSQRSQVDMTNAYPPINSGYTFPDRDNAMSPTGTVTTVSTHQTSDRPRRVRRVFSRQSNSTQQSLGSFSSYTTAYTEFTPDNNMGSLRESRESRMPSVTPSPATRPLLSQPHPRDEFASGRPTTRNSNKPLPQSVITDARRRAEMAMAMHSSVMRLPMTRTPTPDQRMRCMTPDQRIRSTTPSQSRRSMELDAFVGLTSMSIAAEIHAASLRQREEAAKNAAIEPRYIQEWGFFLKCYAEGRFNLSNPPEPPPRSVKFNHLVAPMPPNEPERLRALEQVNVPYPDWATTKARNLVRLARKVFGTSYAAISFIDQTSELMKAEQGYDNYCIPRSQSIGAHVLLSSDLMIVNDVGKDWRLQGNYLVTGAPHIRFYAGAPLITSEGFNVGVFAVFDTKPRADFPLHLRRKLADFAKIVVTDLDIIVEESGSKSDKARSESVMESLNASTTSLDKEPEPTSNAKRLTAKLLKNMEEELKKTRRPEEPDSEDERPEPVENPPLHELTVPEEDEREPESRARSVSSKPHSPTWNPATTTVMTPPETPSRSGSSASDSSCESEAPGKRSLDSVDTATPPEPEAPSNIPDVHVSRPQSSGRPCSSRASNVSSLALKRSSSQSRPLPPALKDPNKLAERTDVYRQQLPRSPGPVTSLAEAGFALSLIAGNLDYDLVYLLRVRPNASGHRSGDDNFISDLLSTRILVAHGLPNPEPVFDPLIHLRALRSEGGVIYQNSSHEAITDGDPGYGIGVLLPLFREDAEGSTPSIMVSDVDDDAECPTRIVPANKTPYHNCKSGVVLAAFKRQAGPGRDFSTEEVAYLREMARNMKEIFIRGEGSPSQSPV